MQTTQALYSATGELYFLNEVERSNIREGRGDFDLPSWVPDWTLPTSYNQGLGRVVETSTRVRHGMDNQAVPTIYRGKSVCSFDLARKQVTLRGFVVDSIRELKTRLKDLSPIVHVQGTKTYGNRLCWKPLPESIQQKSYQH